MILRQRIIMLIKSTDFQTSKKISKGDLGKATRAILKLKRAAYYVCDDEKSALAETYLSDLEAILLHQRDTEDKRLPTGKLGMFSFKDSRPLSDKI